MSEELIVNDSVYNIEKDLISILLNDHSVLEDVLLKLQPSDFDNEYLRRIFAVISILQKEGKKVNSLTIANYIKNHQEYEFDDYQIILDSIDNSYSSSDIVNDYVDLIKNASIKRSLESFANSLLDMKFDVNNFNSQVWELEKKFLDIINSKKVSQIKSMNEICDSYKNKLDQVYNNIDKITGTTSGYSAIDRITNGFQPGDLIILAARPGIGKTTLALNFLYNAAKSICEKPKTIGKQDIVVMFSLEMGSDQLCQRMISFSSLVEISPSRNRPLDQVELASIMDNMDELRTLPIYIDDSSDASILDIQSKLKQLSQNYNIKLVVVDYLQLLKGPKSSNTQTNRQQEVANISRMLKTIARQIQSPIIAIAQLSRKIEERSKGEGRRPILSDLRESGAIEQDADLVTFINYEILDEDLEDDKNNGFSNDVPVEYIIAKHRNGSTGIVNLQFLKRFGKYIPRENK